ncbi:MAG TPA: response regulator, partial [Bacteroidales bacterium]|nr:response regulator [Bacteroidales bacterium]
MELEAILNCTPEGIMVFDTSGKIMRSNIAAERFYKLTDIVRNKTNAERVADDYEAWYDNLRKLEVEELPGYRVAIKGESISNQVLKVRIYNETMWVMFNGAPLRISGELAGGVLSTVDITALKQAEHALQQQNDELKKAKEKAEESDRFKTAFIANISHEIRTPMSGIMGFAELLQNPEISNESQATYIEAIVASGKRMLNIVNDLINISKIEVGQFEMKRETTDIGNLLDELFVFFLPEANRKNIELRLSNQLPADSILIDTDRTKLSQVISNLVKNALKFTSQGFVGFGCLIKNQSYLFYVEDTGAGISKEYQQQIFERFKQGEIPEAGIPEGMGLGLAISKAYIGILGGSLWVDSIPGKGSTFYFTIPLSQKVASTAAFSVANIRNNIKETFAHAEVLIADDEDFIYFFLNEALKANNIKSFHAKNGQEAVDIVRNNPNIQLVLMDSRMPVMGGLEATRQIKQLHPGIPVILLSALAHDSDIKAAFDAGCNDYIVKPFTLVNLKSKLSMYLDIKIKG